MNMSDFERIDKFNPEEVVGINNITNATCCSGPRMQIGATFFEQAKIIDNPEVPRIFTSYEKEFGSYNDSLKMAGVDYRIVGRVEKYPENPGYHYTLILEELNPQQSGFKTIVLLENKHYEHLSENHGYIRQPTSVDHKRINDIIPRGEVISKTTSHDEYLNFRYGVHAKTALISRMENIEDGILISDEFANRVSYTEVSVIDINVGSGDILLNLLGDENNYKCFPDVFEEVKNGIFCAKRSVEYSKASCNTTVNSLMNLETDDELYHGSGKVLDVEIHISSIQELMKSYPHRNQIVNYYNRCVAYAQGIVDAITPFEKSKTHRISAITYTKFIRYKDFIASSKPNSDIIYSSGANVVEFAKLKVIIGKRVSLNNGSKLTNKPGGKGVVCKILPKKFMPRDQYGNVCDVALNSLGVIGRSNPIQAIELELNFASNIIRDRMMDPSLDNQARFNMLKEYFELADPYSAEFLVRNYSDPFRFSSLLESIRQDGIFIRQKTFQSITYEKIKEIYIKFNIEPPYITTSYEINGEIKHYKSINPVFIGEQYLLILKHTTLSKFSVTSVSSTNVLGLPNKNNSKSKQEPYRDTPIKFGDMEVNIALNRMTPELVNRFIAGNGLNRKHRENVFNMLLQEDPRRYHDVNIKSEDIKNNIASDTLVSIMGQLGYRIYSDEVDYDIEYGENPKKD